ncbi:hypothetical protein CK247_31670, partial [Klebsiella pneumoniae]
TGGLTICTSAILWAWIRALRVLSFRGSHRVILVIDRRLDDMHQRHFMGLDTGAEGVELQG